MTDAGATGAAEARDPAHRTLDEMIRTFPAALLTTVDSHGIMHTRQLPNTNAEFKGDLWFLSNHGAQLEGELSYRSDVLVTYAERPAGRFLVVNGTAHVRRDPQRIRELWHPVLASWIPSGPDDDTLSLIQISVGSVEVWD